MSTVSYYTAEGLKKLREELDQLKSIERPKASQAIAEARDKGDLSENAEYDAAKEAQGMLEMRIAKLEEVHSNARLIDETHLDVSKVLVLSNVRIKNQANGMELKYTLVAESEADLKSGKISVSSPIGKGLLGKKVGEIRVVIALILFLIVLIAEGAIIHGAISSAITALGRNPMARKTIIKEMVRVIFVAIIVLVIGLASIYMILWV